MSRGLGDVYKRQLQVLGPDGQIVWQNVKYYPDFDIIEEISEIIR